jgi:hypothetical protein
LGNDKNTIITQLKTKIAFHEAKLLRLKTSLEEVEEIEPERSELQQPNIFVNEIATKKRQSGSASAMAVKILKEKGGLTTEELFKALKERGAKIQINSLRVTLGRDRDLFERGSGRTWKIKDGVNIKD